MKTLVVAPHPDDEVLGVGGTLLRKKAEGEEIGWMILTGMSEEHGWSPESILKRKNEISKVKEFFAFDSVFEMGYPTTLLDQIPMNQLVSVVSAKLRDFAPTEVFVPHPSDIHSDHKVTFDVVASCAKWFRNSSIKRVLAYETLSETELGLDSSKVFRPNVFVDIEAYLERKLSAMSIYSNEIQDFPFPRSKQAITALANIRGASSGFKAAEAFELLREFL